MSIPTPSQIDALLPQTQCGLCSYQGCQPYAEAIAYQREAINRCPPGGVKVLKELAALTNQDPTPYLADMTQKQKAPLLAVIQEDQCIGCTKCIQACPVDAIIGAAKLMHTVITSECTGCELCLDPCPVDCIVLIPAPKLAAEQQNTKANLARQRYQARKQRLVKKAKEKTVAFKEITLANRKAEITAALARAKAKNKPLLKIS